MQPRHLCQTQKRHKTSGYLNYTENSPVCPGLPWLWRQDLPQVWGKPDYGGGWFGGHSQNGKGPWRTLGEVRNIEGGGGEATLHWGSRVKDGFIARAPPKLRKDPEAGEGTVGPLVFSYQIP